jgi:sigma-E factor negative regulatory protein RseA
MPPDAFLSKLQRRLREEAVAAPVPAPAVTAITTREAANDWRWKVAAGVASVAAVVAVGWNVWSAGGSAQPQLAAAPQAAAVVEASATPMMRDPRLDRLLAAHREFGGATALGNTSGFLRNATFEGPAH